MLASRAYLIKVPGSITGEKKMSKLSISVWGVPPRTEHGPIRGVTGWTQ